MLEQSSQSSRSLKIVLSIVLVILLAVLIFIFLVQKGIVNKKTATTTVPAITNQSRPATTNPAGEADVVTGTPSEPATATSSTKLISMQEALAQFKIVQDKIKAGTLSAEEGKKQMDAIGARIAPPALPDTKK